jgi:hypothetical protein
LLISNITDLLTFYEIIIVEAYKLGVEFPVSRAVFETLKFEVCAYLPALLVEAKRKSRISEPCSSSRWFRVKFFLYLTGVQYQVEDFRL